MTDLLLRRDGVHDIQFRKAGHDPVNQQITVTNLTIDPPSAVNDNYTVQVGGDQDVRNVLSNDSGAGRTLISMTPVGTPSGTLDSFQADGTVRYTPPVGGGATSDAWDYVVRTGSGVPPDGGEDTGRVTWTVEVAPPQGSGSVEIKSFAGRNQLSEVRTVGTAPAPFFFSAIASGFGVEDHFFDVRYKWTFDDPGYFDANDADDFPWDRYYNVDGTEYVCRGPDLYHPNGALATANGCEFVGGQWRPAIGTSRTYLGVDKNIAYGAHASHIFDTPGVYVVKCEVQRRGALPVTKTIQITVKDFGAEHAASDTIVFSPSSNWSGEPSGATRVTTWAAARAAAESGPNKRILIHRGAGNLGGITFPQRSAGWETLIIGRYGSGSGRPYRRGGSWIMENAYNGGQISVTLDHIGLHDPTDPWGSPDHNYPVAYGNSNGLAALWDCRIGGTQRGLHVQVSGGNQYTFGLIIGNTLVYDWGDWYGCFAENHTGYLGMKGVFFKQNPDTIFASVNTANQGGGLGTWSRSTCVRYASTKAPVAFSAMHCRNFGDYTTPTGYGFQPTMRPGAYSVTGVQFITETVFDRMVGENGTIMNVGSSGTGRARKLLYDKVLMISTWHAAVVMGPSVSGMHIRNSVITMAGRKMGGHITNWVERGNSGENDPSVGQHGFDFYNSSVIDLRTGNTTASWHVPSDFTDFAWFKLGNNMMEHVNLSIGIETGDGPFDMTASVVPSLDGIAVETTVKDTSYALPVASGSFFRPLTEPPVASLSHSNPGNGQGARIAVDDIWGRVRPSAAHRGPHEEGW